MNTTRKPGVTTLLATGILAVSIAACGGTGGASAPSVLPNVATTNAAANPNTAFPTNTYTMLMPLTLTKGSSTSTLKATASAKCAGLQATQAPPITMPSPAYTAIAQPTISSFTCNGTTRVNTATKYYIVMLTDAIKSISDSNVTPIAGPAVQLGTTLTFPVMSKSIQLDPITPTYFFVAYY